MKRPFYSRGQGAPVGGSSLIELMVTLAVGLALAAIAVSIYVAGKHAFSVHDDMLRIQENGRAALWVLSQDIRLAGYWGLNIQPLSIRSTPSLVIDNDCTPGWSASVVPSIAALNNSNAIYSNCIPDADYAPDTDILTIRHAAIETTEDNQLDDGVVYLRTSLTDGVLFESSSDGIEDPEFGVTEAPLANHRLQVHAYYIRSWSVARGDNVPTLVREMLSGTRVRGEPLVEYVEDLQVTFGLDTDRDGNVDRYESEELQTVDPSNVKTITLDILVRASNPEADYINRQTYTLGDRTNTVDDALRRQVFRKTIFLRNRAGFTAGSGPT